MASFANLTQANVLKLMFNATNWANIADNTATSPATVLYISLHNADPGDGGSQNTNETAYTNYARIAVARTAGGWTISGAAPTQVTNVAAINFAQCGATGDVLTHWGVGLSASGAGTLLASGPIGSGPALGFTCNAASPGQLTVPASAATVNQRVSVYPTPTGALPTGLTEGTVYYVGAVAGNVITLSTTASNGSPVNTSSAGSGNAIFQSPLAVSSGITPSFGAGALILKLW